MKNVLVFPCGSEVGLEINRALADSRHFKLFGANSTDDHGKYVYGNYIGELPFIGTSNFIDKINEIIKLHDIDYIIPAHDSAVLKMAENHKMIYATVLTSCVETCRICRSKKITYKLFEKLILTPDVYSVADKMIYPVFLKPDIGQGSKGACKVSTREECEFYLQRDSTLMALEYLPGKEYTIDCFTDKYGKLLFAEGRERARVCNGISVNSKLVANDQFQEIAQIINKTLSFRGVWFYQVKERANGELVLMEIAPRIAGTMALFRACGVNFIQLSLFDRMGVDVSILHNKLDIEIDRALVDRFLIRNDYSCIYIDFDDTIVIDNSVNTNIMKFLYQSRNMGKRIVLLSKHKHNIRKSLEKYAVSDLLFDEIIILNDNEEKSDYITNANSIFIDDSFYERKKVFDILHIPVFALDSVDALLCWKV